MLHPTNCIQLRAMRCALSIQTCTSRYYQRVLIASISLRIDAARRASTHVFENLLDRARQKKLQNDSEPALTATDFGGMIEEIRRLSTNSFITNNQAHYAAIETACRNIFYNLLVRQTLSHNLCDS